MPAAAPTDSSLALPATTSLREKLVNLFVAPGEVFDEVLAAPPCAVNWRVPTLLVCLAGVLSLQVIGAGKSAAAMEQFTRGHTLCVAETQMLAGAGPLVSSAAICLAAFAGTFWSALVLWFIGRVFLKVRFSFLKTLEVVGLTGIILALGTIVTALLAAASGDPAARPALSLLAGNADAASTLHKLLDTLNVFHLWTTATLSIGLSRLSGVTFKEAAFWVFGFWLIARMALIILS